MVQVVDGGSLVTARTQTIKVESYNTAPSVKLKVTPERRFGTGPSYSVSASLSGTTDAETPFSGLMVSWDLDGDGAYESSAMGDMSQSLTFPANVYSLQRAPLRAGQGFRRQQHGGHRTQDLDRALRPPADHAGLRPDHLRAGRAQRDRHRPRQRTSMTSPWDAHARIPLGLRRRRHLGNRIPAGEHHHPPGRLPDHPGGRGQGPLPRPDRLQADHHRGGPEPPSAGRGAPRWGRHAFPAAAPCGPAMRVKLGAHARNPAKAAPPRPRRSPALLRRWRGGDLVALDDLLPLVYRELQRLAHCSMRGESAAT